MDLWKKETRIFIIMNVFKTQDLFLHKEYRTGVDKNKCFCDTGVPLNADFTINRQSLEHFNFLNKIVGNDPRNGDE